MTRWFAVGLLLVVHSCARDAARSSDSSASTASRDSGVRVHAGGPEARRDIGRISPHAVQWDAPGVVTALRSLGLIVEQSPDSVAQPFMTVRATGLSVRDTATRALAEIQVFIYGDGATAAQELSKLDTVRVAPATMMITWRMPPSLITDNNLIAIVLTRDATLRRAIRQALSRSELSAP